MTIDLSKLTDPGRAMSRAERRRAQRAMRAADRRRRLNPLRYAAAPHPQQERLHCAREKQVILCAANRFGKSTAGVWEVLWRATGTHPYRQLRPHRTIWCGFPSYKFYKRVTKRLFELWMPEDYLIDRNDSDFRLTFRREDGGSCDVFFLSYDTQLDAWAGGAVDFIWLDEEPPEEISREAYARTVDTRGQIYRTYTPIQGMGWSYDQLYLPAKEGRRNMRLIEGALAEWDEEAYLNVGRVLVPHLEYDDVIAFAEQYPDEAERMIRVFGQYAKRQGLVFRGVDADTHYVDLPTVPTEWELFGSVDPGFHGFAALLWGVTPHDQSVVVDEFFSQQRPTSERLDAMADMVRRARFAGPSATSVVFFCDTEDPQVVLELNILAQQRNLPLVFTQLEQGLKAVKAGLIRGQELLHPSRRNRRLQGMKRPASWTKGEPRIYIRRGLHSVWRAHEKMHEGSRLLWELARFQWKRVKEEERDVGDDSSADGAHMTAAFRYGYMARYGHTQESETPEPEGEHDWIWKQVQELDERQTLHEERYY